MRRGTSDLHTQQRQKNPTANRNHFAEPNVSEFNPHLHYTPRSIGASLPPLPPPSFPPRAGNASMEWNATISKICYTKVAVPIKSKRGPHLPSTDNTKFAKHQLSIHQQVHPHKNQFTHTGVIQKHHLNLFAKLKHSQFHQIPGRLTLLLCTT